MITAIAFLGILSILVLVHELGHFIVGRLAGVGVLEFALGLPFTKPLWSKKLKSGMKISLYPLLFGGFVKLLGEEGRETKNNETKDNRYGIKDKRKEAGTRGKYFYKVGVGARMAVVVAGVAMNALLAALVFYLFLALSGHKVLIPKITDYQFRSKTTPAVAVTFVDKDTPAKTAGLAAGEVILSADGQTFPKLSDFQKYIRGQGGQEVKLAVSETTVREVREVRVMPRKDPPPGQGPLGVGVAEALVLSYPTAAGQAASGIIYGADMLGYNLSVLKHLALRAVEKRDWEPLSESVSGPVGIAGAVGTILTLGGGQAVVQLLNLLGLLSLSLAFMNILPFPALDGGRLAFLLVEAVSGKKVPAKIENLINQIGIGILLIFIILVSFNDLRRWVF